MTYDIQRLIGKCMICQEVPAAHRNNPRATPISMAYIGNRFILLEKDDFLIVADVFSKYILVRKLPNSTSAAMCIELSMIFTELGLPHIIISDNDPCYNSKGFQQFLHCYSFTHQKSSPNHPRSNGFVERMVGVAKKLMDKAGKEGKLIKRQGNNRNPERKYQELLPGTPVLVQQAECYMETSNSVKPMCTKFILDLAGKWCRTTQSV